MKHWTEDLFREHPELFLDFFQARMEAVPGEIDTLLKRLKHHRLKAGRMLDLNCGIGRHTLELAARGVEMVGTDISGDYIDIACRRAAEAGVSKKVTFKVADMRRILPVLAGQAPFDGAICLWTSFGFYDDATNQDILAQCLELVKPSGFFVLDIINRDWLINNFSHNGFETGKSGIVLEERRFDPYTSRNYNTWKFLKLADSGNLEFVHKLDFDHRVWSLHELIYMFSAAGWDFVAAYPGFASRQHTSASDDILQSPMLMTICRRNK